MRLFYVFLSLLISLSFFKPVMKSSALFVSRLHPVTGVLGTAATLSMSAYKAYQSNRRQQKFSNLSLPQHVQTNRVASEKEAIVAEQKYYQERKKNLEIMKNEFALTQRDLLVIKELFDSSSFSAEFLQQKMEESFSVNDTYLVLPENQMKSSETQEQKLIVLEEEIVELHALLAAHFDGLMVQVPTLLNKLDDYLFDLNDTLQALHNNANTDAAALQLYEKYVYVDFLTRDAHQKLAELKATGSYYRVSGSSSCMARGSNLFEKLDLLDQYLAEKEAWLSANVTISAENIADIEKDFTQNNISFVDVKKWVENRFSQDRVGREIEFIKWAQENRAKIRVQLLGHSIAVEEEDLDEDDKCQCNCGCDCKCGQAQGNFFEKLKKNHAKKVLVKKYGPFFQDLVTKLWWTEDNAEHSGRHCKVYKKISTGFEWVRDTTFEGVTIEKHKSDGSKFIPHKNIIPCSQNKKKICINCISKKK